MERNRENVISPNQNRMKHNEKKKTVALNKINKEMLTKKTIEMVKEKIHRKKKICIKIQQQTIKVHLMFDLRL